MRHYLGRIFATCVSIVLNLPVYDTQCGAKLFKAGPELGQVMKEPFQTKWIFDVEIYARFLKLLDHFSDTTNIPWQEKFYEMDLKSWEDVSGSKLKGTDFLAAFFDLLKIHRIYKN